MIRPCSEKKKRNDIEMKVTVQRLIWSILIIANCIAIFQFSSQNAQISGNTSGRVVDWIAELIPSIQKLNEEEKTRVKEEIMQPIIRKLAHFSIYALLGFLIMGLASTYQGTFYQKILCSVLLACIYAISDEVHQLFISGRSGQITDVLIDTAGIHETEDLVEKIGVDKSLRLIEEADLVILVLNQNEKLSAEDRKILSVCQNKKTIVVLNKSDLEKRIEEEEIPYSEIIHTNTLDGNGIEPLKRKISELFHLEQLQSQDDSYLSNIRQISLAKEALSILEEVTVGIEQEVPVDMIEIDIKRSWEKLGEIIGETYTEELIDQLFSQFCLGK